MPYIAHVPDTPWMNPFHGEVYSSEQAYRHAMMCESSQDMFNWRDFQRSHGLNVTSFGERPGCVLTGLTGKDKKDKQDKIASNTLQAAKKAAKLLADAV